MIASLPMYYHPRLADAYRRYWALIRRNLCDGGIDAPAALTCDSDRYAVWLSPDLLLSQTCGLPYRTRLHGHVQLVATPDFGVEGCRPGYYHSVLVVRADEPRTAVSDFAGSVLAYNGADSQSGYAAPFHHAERRGFRFQNLLHSGQHLASAELVARGAADIAALDVVTWRIIAAHEPVAAALRILETTAETPGLPYITSLGQDRGIIFDALDQAIERLDAGDRRQLGLKGVVKIPVEDYLAVPNPAPIDRQRA